MMGNQHEKSSPNLQHHKCSCSKHNQHKCHSPKRRRSKNNCKKDCLCKLLRKHKHGELTITTKTGKTIKGKLQHVKGCCAKILEPGSTSPFTPKRLTIIRCTDIESFSADCV